MPKKNGLEVVQELKNYFKETKKQNTGLEIIEPEYVFLTAFSTNSFRNYLKTMNIEHCYEKPVSAAMMDDLMKFYVFADDNTNAAD